MGWTKKVLRVDLTKGTCKSEPLNMKWAQDYLGQRGLATKYFVEEVDPKVDPLSPANKLIMATGPLTGTPVSTGGRYSVITKGALTGAIACSNSGGYFGAEMKFAGWDMVIFEGKSPKPVYLSIEDDKAELRDAAHLWGKTVWQTEEIIKKSHQDPQTRVASIGRAGENGVLYACIVNDLHRAAGRSGVGAVMGSKNLKAVAVRGTKGGGKIKDPKAFMQAVAAGKKALAENPVTSQGLPKFGTQVLMNVINEAGALPTRNHRDVQFEDASKISAEAMIEKRPDGKSHLVANAACFGCTIACGRISKLDEKHFSVVNKPQYWGASGGLEYEAAWALGAANGVGDLEALQYANLLCNEDGYDPISFGATVGAAMDLYDLGILTREQIGLEAPFGSAEALVKLSEMTAKGEGFGKELGLGSARLCAKCPALREVRQARALHGRQETGVSRLRCPRRPGNGPRLRYLESRRLPSARLHGGLRGHGLAGQDRSAGDRRQGRTGKGLPGHNRGVRFRRHLPFHELCLDAGRCAAAGGRCLRGRLVDGKDHDHGRAHLEHGAPLQQCRRFHRQGRRPAAAPEDRAGKDRPGQGQGERDRHDASGVLQAARLG